MLATLATNAGAFSSPLWGGVRGDSYLSRPAIPSSLSFPHEREGDDEVRYVRIWGDAYLSEAES